MVRAGGKEVGSECFLQFNILFEFFQEYETTLESVNLTHLLNHGTHQMVKMVYQHDHLEGLETGLNRELITMEYLADALIQSNSFFNKVEG